MSRNQFQELLQGRTGRMRATRLAPALGCVGLLAFSVYFSRDLTGGDQVVANAVAKANAFLETLDGPAARQGAPCSSTVPRNRRGPTCR